MQKTAYIAYGVIEGPPHGWRMRKSLKNVVMRSAHV